VFETLKAIAKITVPYVKEKIFGEKRETVEKEKEEQQIIIEEAERERKKLKEGVRGEVKKAAGENIEFVSKQKEAPIRMTKIKFRDQKDIEKEVENLAKEFSHLK